jgi:hypothetical protein
MPPRGFNAGGTWNVPATVLVRQATFQLNQK